MGLDQLAAVEHLDERPVGAHVDLLAAQLARNRVQRFGEVDVMVAVHLGLRPNWHVIALGWGGQQPWGLGEGEHLGGAGLGGGVDPYPGDLGAPALSRGVGRQPDRRSPGRRGSFHGCSAQPAQPEACPGR